MCHGITALTFFPLSCSCGVGNDFSSSTQFLVIIIGITVVASCVFGVRLIVHTRCLRWWFSCISDGRLSVCCSLCVFFDFLASLAVGLGRSRVFRFWSSVIYERCGRGRVINFQPSTSVVSVSRVIGLWCCVINLSGNHTKLFLKMTVQK